MPTITSNLFHGQGETEHRLDVVEGHWPTDADGWVFIVGPDKRSPGGHWFGEQGLLCRIDCTPDARGRIRVQHRRVDTWMNRLRERFGKAFRKVVFLEVSPFGFSNLANTNVQALDGRLFIGYDAGRPMEVDPATLEFITPVGSNAEWFQTLPGPVEPLVQVAAHPGPSAADGALWFLNYNPVPTGETDPDRYLVRWDLDGPLKRWRVAGMGRFDSIHDVKTSDRHVLVTDLPFVVEPAVVTGGERTLANDDGGALFIISKEAVASTPEGGTVEAVRVDLPWPTGHFSVDADDADGVLTVYCEHVPLNDLMLSAGADSTDRHGTPLGAEFEGMPVLGVQPGLVGRHRIEAATGQILESETVHDERFWGGILATRNPGHYDGTAGGSSLWFAGMGYDPEVVPSEWWDLYADTPNACVVHPSEMPTDAIPAALARFDLESMKVPEVAVFGTGEVASPPQFIPRRDSDDDDDGYVLVVVHKDGAKELRIFDGMDLERGPLAVASAPDFNPPLLLHSTWMPENRSGRRSRYSVRRRADVAGAVRRLPSVLFRMVRSTGAAVEIERDRRRRVEEAKAAASS